MSKFKFSLEKILGIREFEEDQAKLELGKAIQETERIKRQLEYIAQQKIKTSKGFNQTINIDELQSLQLYLNGLDTQKESLLVDLAQAELVVEQKRLLLTQAMQKRKALDKLKEKQLAEFKKEEERAEENFLDDLRRAKN